MKGGSAAHCVSIHWANILSVLLGCNDEDLSEIWSSHKVKYAIVSTESGESGEGYMRLGD